MLNGIIPLVGTLVTGVLMGIVMIKLYSQSSIRVQAIIGGVVVLSALIMWVSGWYLDELVMQLMHAELQYQPTQFIRDLAWYSTLSCTIGLVIYLHAITRKTATG